MYEDQAEHLNELVAQMDDHGEESVRLYLIEGNEIKPLYIVDVQYIDGEIQVKVGL